MLTTRLYPDSKLRMSGAVLLLPLYVFMEWRELTLPFFLPDWILMLLLFIWRHCLWQRPYSEMLGWSVNTELTAMWKEAADPAHIHGCCAEARQCTWGTVSLCAYLTLVRPRSLVVTVVPPWTFKWHKHYPSVPSHFYNCEIRPAFVFGEPFRFVRIGFLRVLSVMLLFAVRNRQAKWVSGEFELVDLWLLRVIVIFI